MKKNRFFGIILFILPIILVFSFFAFSARAGTGTIDGTYDTAEFVISDGLGGTEFNPENGTIKFQCDTNCAGNNWGITITDTEITGYAWGDRVGWINFSPANGFGGVEVMVATVTTGVLSGYAWGQNSGWVNFDPPNGGVTITTTTGQSEFNGFAWAQNYGWIEFDCSTAGIADGQCVKTNWQPTLGGDGGDDDEEEEEEPLPPPVYICTNLQGGPYTTMPNHYMIHPDIINHVGECILIPVLTVSIEYPANGSTFLSADATPDDIPLANFKIRAKVTGSTSGVEFFVDGISIGQGVLVDGTTDIYETPESWSKSVECPADGTTDFPTFSITATAKNITDILDAKTVSPVVIKVGRPCTPDITQCSDGEDNDNDHTCDYEGCTIDGIDFLKDPDCNDDINNNSEEGVFCILHPDDLLGCICPTNPNTLGCPGFCETNPDDPSCSFCSFNPNDPSCSLCALNPDDPSCGINPCLADPDSPECLKKDDVIGSPIRNILIDLFSAGTVKKIDIGFKIAATASAVVSAVVSLGTALFLNPLAAPELVLIPVRLWSLLLTALGLKKRRKPWGTVYDSITKQPLDPVYVSLLNLEGVEVASSITDVDGRYGFLVQSGVYKVVPKKTNYLFPSDKLSKHFRDEFYQDLYFGDYMNISAGEVIIKNVPMDPINFDWNEFAKNKKQLFKFYSKKELIIARISNWLFSFGFTIATLALLVSPEKYNIIIFGLYIAMFILRRVSFKLKAKGRLLTKHGFPLAFAFIRIFSVETNVEIAHKVADQMGRYYALVPNGTYYAKIEKKNNDGTYTLVHTSNYFKIIHGVLNRVFNI